MICHVFVLLSVLDLGNHSSSIVFVLGACYVLTSSNSNISCDHFGRLSQHRPWYVLLAYQPLYPIIWRFLNHIFYIQFIHQFLNHFSIIFYSCYLMVWYITLPNIQVAQFLRVNTETGLFYFDSSYRPVPLAQQYIGISEQNFLARAELLNEICYNKVYFSPGFSI